MMHWPSTFPTGFMPFVYEIPGFVIWRNQYGTCIRSTNLSKALQANWTSIIFNLEKYCVVTLLRKKLKSNFSMYVKTNYESS